jgi:hypothetical protein
LQCVGGNLCCVKMRSQTQSKLNSKVWFMGLPSKLPLFGYAFLPELLTGLLETNWIF